MPIRDGFIDAAEQWTGLRYWAGQMSESALKRSKHRTQQSRDAALIAGAMEAFINANPDVTILTAANVIPYLQGRPDDDLDRVRERLCNLNETVKTGFRYFDHWHNFEDIFEGDREKLEARIKANTEVKEIRDLQSAFRFYSGLLERIADGIEKCPPPRPRMMMQDVRTAFDFVAGSWPGIDVSHPGLMLDVEIEVKRVERRLHKAAMNIRELK